MADLDRKSLSNYSEESSDLPQETQQQIDRLNDCVKKLLEMDLPIPKWFNVIN